MSTLSAVAESLIPGMTAGVKTALPYITGLSLQGTVLSGEYVTSLYKGPQVLTGAVLSANEIIRQVRAAGFKVNRQSALQVISALKGQVKEHEYITSLTGGIKPLASRVGLAGYKQRYKYNVRVLIHGFNSITGDTIQQYVTVTSTRLVSKSEAIGVATDMLLNPEQYQPTDITDVQVVGYTKQNPNIQ